LAEGENHAAPGRASSGEELALNKLAWRVFR
jgi:hypothetical protein